jgi:chromosome segregation ATPase
MKPETQTLLTVAVPTLAVLIGILVNNSRLSDMRSHFDKRIDDLKETWRSELRRVEEVIDARLTNLEQRMAHLEQRMEHLER